MTAARELDIRTIELRIGQLVTTQCVDDWVFAARPEVRAAYLLDTARALVRLTVRYAEQPCKSVTYPTDWWQAVKQRFAPAWALKHWPVKLTVWEPFVIYPEIALPTHKHYVQIRQLENIPEWQE